MAKRSRKPHSGRRGGDNDVQHWLEEGGRGQEFLFHELDPALVAIDQALCRSVTQLAFRLAHRQMPAAAVLFPAAGRIPWQITHLSKHFQVYLWVEEPDELTYATIDHFGCGLLSESLDELPGQVADLMLFTRHHWHTYPALSRVMQEVEQYLSPDGEISFVLTTEQMDGTAVIRWGDGSATALNDIVGLARAENGTRRAAMVEEIDIMNFHSGVNFDMGAFLKRHRDFFGRDTRDMLVQRIGDEDYLAELAQAKLKGLRSVLLLWR